MNFTSLRHTYKPDRVEVLVLEEDARGLAFVTRLGRTTALELEPCQFVRSWAIDSYDSPLNVPATAGFELKGTFESGSRISAQLGQGGLERALYELRRTSGHVLETHRPPESLDQVLDSVIAGRR